ncbi:MAG: DUF2271 domain-containing protein [Bacteroidales bacterium]|nr:DUF2271 domain-containing protein [Bacteroidales bacterium]
MSRLIFLLMIFITGSCSSWKIKNLQSESEQIIVINSNIDGKGPEITLEFYKGKSFYYPLMAVWIEDESGLYIQTLFVPESVATGIFKYGKQAKNKWIPAPRRAPQTLPYWSHKRGVVASDGLYMPEPENPVADAYTGATPVKSFVLQSRADNELPDKFRLLFEINQNWDWNEHWTNDKFPEDENYKCSCQPAVVYEALINTMYPERSYLMKPIGHSHYSGKTGELFPDLSSLTTALQIADSIVIRLKLAKGDSQLP